MAKRSAGAVLLDLLQLADAPTLLVLMKAENLIVVLRHCGRDDASTRAALTAGELPGELLLALFREGRKPEELIAALGPSGAAELAAERASTPAPAASLPAPAASVP